VRTVDRIAKSISPRLGLPLLGIALAVLVLAAQASAAPPLLWQQGSAGVAAGQFGIPRGVAANPTNGHLFVADQPNRRIVELNAFGDFVSAWGWGVRDGAYQFQTCTAATSCGAGLQGGGNAQFSHPQGVAVDSEGDVYVLDASLFGASRVDKFSPSGQFLRSWGGDVVSLGAGDSGADERVSVDLPASVTAGRFTLTLTNARGLATYSSGSEQLQVSPLRGQFEVGDRLSASGIPAGTTVTAVSGATLTISQQTTDQASGQQLTATETTVPIAWNAPAGGPGSLAEALEGLPAIGASGVAVSGGPGASGTPFTITFSGGGLAHDDVAPLSADSTSLTGGAVGIATLDQGGGPEVCLPADTCQIATGNGADGELDAFQIGDYLAAAPGDQLYVGGEGRIQRFDAAGAFQASCTVPGTVVSLDADAAGDLYAAYFGTEGVRKLSFSPGGDCTEVARFDIPSPGPTVNPAPTAIAVTPQNHVYAFSSAGGGVNSIPLLDRIFEFSQAGAVLDQFGKGEFSESSGLAANLCPGSEAPGNLYVVNSSSSQPFVRAYGSEPVGCSLAATAPASAIAEFAATLNGTVNPRGGSVDECQFEYGLTASYGQTIACQEYEAGGVWHPLTALTQLGTGVEPVPVRARPGGLEAATEYHFNLRAAAGGPAETGADRSFKTLGPPVVSDDFTAAVSTTSATVRATVNPEGFPSDYRVEYVARVDFEQSGFAAAESTPSRPLAGDRADHPIAVTLTALAPGTDYAWRLVASNSAVTDGGVTEGAARFFTTYRPVPSDSDCPNQALRGGPSGFLPDCRAYEMVSPVDKNGGEIVNNAASLAIHAAYIQSRADGGKITYSAAPSFGDQLAARHQNQYIATRGAGGWSNHGINAPLGAQPGYVIPLDNVVGPFSADLCSSWLADRNVVPLTPDAQAGYTNLYRRQNCEPGEGGFEALTTASPPPGTEPEYVSHRRSVQGFSADGSAAFFVAGAALTPDAAAGTQVQIYLYLPEQTQLRLVSILPSGVAAAPGAGSELGGAVNGAGNLHNAVSVDGRRVFWTAHSEGNTSAGSVYLRQNPAEPQSALEAGACTEPAKACTVPVSAGAAATFWDATPDGSAAIYTEGNLGGGTADLFRFDTASRTRTKIAEGVYGVAGASEDLSRIYLVSTKASAPGATLGQPNLYLLEGGGFSLVGTLLPVDVAGGIAAKVTTTKPFERATRVTPDGGSIVFQSRAPLTGFDNADAESGALDIEVFTYAAGGEVRCVSCNPSGARPAGRELPTPYVYPRNSVFDPATQTGVGAAAWIPTWEHPLHASRVISGDGRRIFFNSNDALLPADGNGTQDVYQWEAPGKGSCRAGDENHFAQNGGCLSLISSGESALESEFWEASASGDDVFFTTESSLVEEDPGLIDLYDARVEGGIPPAERPAACEGEACQAPPAAPLRPNPASAAYTGPGNVRQPAAKRKGRCPKGKKRVRRHGKVRCVTKRRRHLSRKHHQPERSPKRAHPDRRTAR
jgi:hypothetical protein